MPQAGRRGGQRGAARAGAGRAQPGPQQGTPVPAAGQLRAALPRRPVSSRGRGRRPVPVGAPVHPRHAGHRRPAAGRTPGGVRPAGPGRGRGPGAGEQPGLAYPAGRRAEHPVDAAAGPPGLRGESPRTVPARHEARPVVVRRFEELDYQPTPIGAVSLRRRHDPHFNTEVYEIKIDDDFLMSSLFTVGEVELARLGLAACAGTDLDVVVGGLGLGYTALTVLEDSRVRSLVVVEALDAVIGWHRRGLVPAGVV